MDHIKSKRELNIEKFLDQIISQEEWELKQTKRINKFFNAYPNELEDYVYVKDEKEFDDIKIGGYIRYFNYNNEMKWGGILVNKYKDDKNNNLMVLTNSSFKRFIVSFNKNYIFYKKHTTQADKTRKLFLSYLDNN